MLIAWCKRLLLSPSILEAFAQNNPVRSQTECPKIGPFLPGSRVCSYFNEFLEILTEKNEFEWAREVSGTVPVGSWAQFNFLMGSDSCLLLVKRSCLSVTQCLKDLHKITASGVGQSARESDPYCLRAGFAHISMNSWRFWPKKNESGSAREALGTVLAGSWAQFNFLMGSDSWLLLVIRGCSSVT